MNTSGVWRNGNGTILLYPLRVATQGERPMGPDGRTSFSIHLGLHVKSNLRMRLSHFASFHRSQVMLRGGRSAACENLLIHANDPQFRSGYFVKADVKSYYDAIAHEYLEEVLPAPKAIIRSTLLLRGWTIIGAAVGQRGIPQGSAASSLVGEMVMANVLASAADRMPATLITYSDDLGGLVPTRAEAVSLVECLKHAFETHGAGPFCLTQSITSVNRAFRFLGYEFERLPEAATVRVNAPPGLSDAKHIEFANAFVDARTVDEWLAICRRLQSFYAAYSLAADVTEVIIDILSFAIAELRHRRSVGA